MSAVDDPREIWAEELEENSIRQTESKEVFPLDTP